MKSKLKTILIVVAAALVLCLTLGLILNFTRTDKDGGTVADGDVMTKVDNCSLQESLAFYGDGTSANSVRTMSATTYAASSDEEVVASGNTATLTLKLTSSVLSEVVLEKVNVPVTWNLEFVNADSTWATGKSVTDYVTVTPNSDFTRTVTLTNLAPFGEQIRLTATLDSDSTMTASCVIDYVKRFGGGLQEMYCFNDFGDDIYAGGTIAMEEAVGTVMGELNAYGTYIELDSGFTSLVQSYLKFDVEFSNYAFGDNVASSITYNSYYKYYAFGVDALNDAGNAVVADYSHFIRNWNSLTEAQKTAVKYAWWTAYQEYGDNVTIDLVFDYSYGSKTLGQISGYRSAYITGESYGDGITVDGSLVNIVF